MLDINKNEVHKTDLVEYIQHTVGLSENKSKIIIKKIFEWIILNLSLNRKVSIKEFGIFYNTIVKSTTCSHPKTGEDIVIGEQVRIIFKPEKTLKDKVRPILNKQSVNNTIDQLFTELQDELDYDATDLIKRERYNSESHKVRSSLLNYLKANFPYGNDWVHPITYKKYSNNAIKKALCLLNELNPEQYRILWAMWTTRKDSLFLATKFYCSAQTIKRQWERAIDLLAVLLFFPELNKDISKVTKLLD